MKRYLFYTRYALRSFRRSGTRAVFATFCVAVGVAAVVALQLVAANFRTSITGDAQKSNRGDVSVAASTRGMPPKDYAVFAQLKRQGSIVDYQTLNEQLVAVRVVGGTEGGVFGAIDGVNPAKFPYYGRVTADLPKGVPISKLLSDPLNVVVSHSVYDKLKLKLGDRIYADIEAHHSMYIVAGVIPDTAIPFSGNILALEAYVMTDYQAVADATRGRGIVATSVFVRTKDATQAAQVKRTLTARLGPTYTINTAADIEQANKDASSMMDKFLTIMGLLALAIGGIGIFNTMLVAARRRYQEIAILKSLGMKGYQVIGTFTIGALLLGLIGGIVGIFFGIGASKFVNAVTQNLLPTTSLQWSIHPRPIIAGLGVAMVGTVLFAFIPVLRESQVKPIAALRREEAHPQKSLTKRSVKIAENFALTVGMAMVMGILAAFFVEFGSPLTNLIVGAIIGLGGLVVLMVLTELFSLVIGLISKLPGLGRLTLRLAFRSMGRQRRRMATTVLALCIGLLGVGCTAILAQNLKSEINGAAARDNSFNTLIFYGRSRDDMMSLRTAVAQLQGIKTREFAAVSGRTVLATVDGQPAQPRFTLAVACSKSSKSAALKKVCAAQYPQGVPADINLQQAGGLMVGLQGRDLRAVGTLTAPISEGQTLTARDAGSNRVLFSGMLAPLLRVHPGSTLGYMIEGRLHLFTVAGITSRTGFIFALAGTMADNGYLQRIGALHASDIENYSTTYLQIDNKYLAGDLATLRQYLPNAQVLDLNFVTGLIGTWVDKFALFPEILAALSLFAGVVIIANAVAMNMMERRREIGIMKAVGARRRFVLQELLTETGVIGLLGAMAGTGLAMMATAVLDKQFLRISASFDWLVILGLLALGTGLAVVAAAVTAWPASGEKPITVLRYE
ncbi:MAG TPA: FtsX-like permease family protein [Chloroflexota bacterium]